VSARAAEALGRVKSNPSALRYEELLSFYQFDDWNSMYTIYILVPYMVFVNLLVLYVMLPDRARIRIFNSKQEDPRLGGASSRNNSRASSVNGGALEDMVGGASRYDYDPLLPPPPPPPPSLLPPQPPPPRAASAARARQPW
jgi:hypothetical protein